MKKVILFAAILFTTISIMNVQAQEVTIGKEAKLTLNLKAVLSVKVEGDVIIDYEKIADYNVGKEGNAPTTITITSAGGFTVKAEAKTDLIDGEHTIKANTITLIAAGLNNAGSSTFIENSKLGLVSETNSALITSPIGGVDKQYTVKYKGAGGNEYFANYVGGGRKYETTVVYTVTTN